MGALEVDVEVVGHQVVLHQVIEGVRQPGARHRAARGPLGGRPPVLIGLGVQEPGPPARRIDGEGDRDHAQEVADSSCDDALQEPGLDLRAIQRRGVPHHHQDPDGRQVRPAAAPTASSHGRRCALGAR